MSVTPKDVADWMHKEIRKRGLLHQCDVVYEIRDVFGEEFTYLNLNGNLAIDRRVLGEFRKLTEDTIVWDRSECFWRGRTKHDGSRRQQE